MKRRPRCSTTTTRGPWRGGGVGGRREGRVFLTGARISAAGSSKTVKSAVTGYYRVTGNADRRRVAAMGFVCTVTALSVSRRRCARGRVPLEFSNVCVPAPVCYLCMAARQRHSGFYVYTRTRTPRVYVQYV